jgi:hypothetical protein
MPEFVSKPFAPQQRKEDLNTIQGPPGTYEAALREVCTLAMKDPYFWLTDEADLPGRAEEFRAEEAQRIEAEIEKRRGGPVHCQSWQLPNGLDGRFPHSPSVGIRCYTVEPTDVVTLRPVPAQPHNGREAS